MRQHSCMLESSSNHLICMLTSRLLVQTAVIMTLAGCAASPPVQLENRSPTDFSGFWELNDQMSEDPAEKIRWLYTVARSDAERRQARGSMNRRESSRIIASKRPLGNMEAIIGLGRLAAMISKATVLTITQTDEQIIIGRDDDFALVCDFDAAQNDESRLGQERCGWLNSQLAFEIHLPEGLSVSHLLTLAPDGNRLNLATTVHSSRASVPFTLNRVYVPFEPTEDLYDCVYTIVHKRTCKLGGSSQ